MDKDRIAGSLRQAGGTVRQAIGKLLGDRKTEVEGKAEKSAGKAQNIAGGLKDAAREAVGKK
ncbi:MAG: CsbD family protein [Acetobacteraceae bacterium]